MKVILKCLIIVAFVTNFAIVQAELTENPIKLHGLKAAAKIVRDVEGIAHIFATNEHDLFFLQGYVHARDRLFQMDVSRRRGSGRLAELLGPQALRSDGFFRTLGLHRAAERSLKAYSPKTRNALEAYSAGVNAYVSQHPLPPEYGSLELSRFEPWTPLDSATVVKLIGFGLSFELGDIDRSTALLSYQKAGKVFAFDGTALFFEDLFRSAPFDTASTVPDASKDLSGTAKAHNNVHARQHGIKTDNMHPQAVKLGRKYLDLVRSISYLRGMLNRDNRAGSNEWVISGTHTTSGLPLLANDPHLALGAPSTFYPIHLRAGCFDVIGSGFAGLPAIIVGHNRFIAWGSTINPMDVTDVYQEQIVPDQNSPSGLSIVYRGEKEHILAIPETYRVNVPDDGISDNLEVVPPNGTNPASTLIVPRRNRGPIIQLDLQTGVALSVQYTGFSATRELDTFLIWDCARGLDDFMEGLQYFDFGSQNFAYADEEGNIAYFTSGEMPIREDLQAGAVVGLSPLFIRNGTEGNEWLPLLNPQAGQAIPYEILPFDEMPKLINPPGGWFVNANNDPAGTTLDNDPLNQFRPGGGIFYLGSFYNGGFRAGRITDVIRNHLKSLDDPLSFEDMQVIQADTVLRDAQVFVPYILQAMKNAERADAHPLLSSFASNAEIVEAVNRFETWDFTTPSGIAEGYDAHDTDGQLQAPSAEEIVDSVAATIYSTWRGQFIKDVIDENLKSFDLPVPPSQQALSALRNLLDNFSQNQGVGLSGLDFFQVPGVDSAPDRRDIYILQSLAVALERLAGDPFAAAFAYSTDQDDYRWGKLHRIVLEHPLGEPFSIPPAGGAFPAPLEDLPGIPTDGGYNTVDASTHNARAQSVNEFMFTNGPANRFVTELRLSGRVRTESIWPGGTSGVPGSKYYLNMLPLWLTNDTIFLPLWMSDIEKVQEEATVYVPGS